MKVDFKQTFLKELKKLKNEKLKNSISDCINDIEEAKSSSQIKNVKKLSGYDDYYRIRISDYRIGIKVEHEIIYCFIFEQRKDVYENFP